jgi:hypothetical protein
MRDQGEGQNFFAFFAIAKSAESPQTKKLSNSHKAMKITNQKRIWANG